MRNPKYCECGRMLSALESRKKGLCAVCDPNWNKNRERWPRKEAEKTDCASHCFSSSQPSSKEGEKG